MPTAPSFVTDDHAAECAAVAGLRFCQMVAPLAEPGLTSGQLVRLLERHDPEPWSIYVYRVQRALVLARVRLAYDALVDVLR